MTQDHTRHLLCGLLKIYCFKARLNIIVSCFHVCLGMCSKSSVCFVYFQSRLTSIKVISQWTIAFSLIKMLSGLHWLDNWKIELLRSIKERKMKHDKDFSDAIFPIISQTIEWHHRLQDFALKFDEEKEMCCIIFSCRWPY